MPFKSSKGTDPAIGKLTDTFGSANIGKRIGAGGGGGGTPTGPYPDNTLEYVIVDSGVGDIIVPPGYGGGTIECVAVGCGGGGGGAACDIIGQTSTIDPLCNKITYSVGPSPSGVGPSPMPSVGTYAAQFYDGVFLGYIHGVNGGGPSAGGPTVPSGGRPGNYNTPSWNTVLAGGSLGAATREPGNPGGCGGRGQPGSPIPGNNGSPGTNGGKGGDSDLSSINLDDVMTASGFGPAPAYWSIAKTPQSGGPGGSGSGGGSPGSPGTPIGWASAGGGTGGADRPGNTSDVGGSGGGGAGAGIALFVGESLQNSFGKVNFGGASGGKGFIIIRLYN